MMAPVFGKDKFQRIQELIDWGYNSPVYHVITERKGLEQRIADLMLSNEWKTVSIRFLGAMGKQWNSIINQEFSIIQYQIKTLSNQLPIGVSQGMPIAVKSGCILIDESGGFVAEVIRNRPVRDLTWAKVKPDYTYRGNIYHKFYECEDLDIRKAIKEASGLPVKPPFIMEFSLFKKGYGIKNEKLLFWEYHKIGGRYDGGL